VNPFISSVNLAMSNYQKIISILHIFILGLGSEGRRPRDISLESKDAQ
jgi:hypothetical protein